ncbi:hypothetical protein HMPREF3289_01200 [Pseudomonas sp. HMSC75E02]|uniref:DUF6941 family protein n=1 Tax=Pseudomonas sp. HMSC75E02 TaxID=1608908 RepID=UPI0008A944C3|nr:hypothetical protein [Pseudomonas sp. HMSC75E02]OHS09312.1 hypothetical protein HMPREF3289_01200 [Pseudomonas sp. HMSC75E02]
MARQLFTLYCDDIRTELGGKVSYMGCYAGVMYVPQFPATLPKLCMFLKATSPSTQPFGRVTVRVLYNDKVIGEQEIDPMSEPEPAPDDSRKRLHTIRVHFIFSPAMLPEPGLIKVRFIDEKGKEMKGTSLRIEQGDPGQFPPDTL